MEEALLNYLLAGTALAALVGTRINWVRSAQGTLSPRVVIYKISGIRDMCFRGPTGYISTRVQVDCISTTYSSAKVTARAVETLISGYSGTTGGVNFQGIFLINERDDFFDSDTPDKLFRTSLDFNVWHK